MSEIGGHAPIEDVIDRLADRFPSLTRKRITEAVSAQLKELEGAHVTDFVPVLAEHGARGVLRREAVPAPLIDETVVVTALPSRTDDPLETDPMEVERRSRARGLYLGDIDS